MKVPSANNPLLLDHHHRIVTCRVKLTLENLFRPGPPISSGTVNLWDTAKGVRILNFPAVFVACDEFASGQKLSEMRGHLELTGVRSSLVYSLGKHRVGS